MTKIQPRTLKGFRDFLPSESILRQKVINSLRKSFEIYGFDPLETPALEYADILLNKYGEEADKLIYLFKDRGGRNIGLRYDQTVPLARVIAQYQNIIKPFKRYQIQPVWRAENPQKGRYREFIQCDIDIIGENSLLAEVEIINLVLRTIKKLGFSKAKMLINDRAVFKNFSPKVISSIDKLEKIGEGKVVEELKKKGVKNAKKIINQIKKIKPTKKIKDLFSLLSNFELKEGIDFTFSPTLARGLDYYTGIIFELIDDNYQGGSLGGGGRYDNLIGQFTNIDMPAIGFSFGFDRIIEIIKENRLLPEETTLSSIYIAYFKENRDVALRIAEELRKSEINTDINLNEERKIEKQLKYANKKGFKLVVIIAPEELKKQSVILKKMKKKEQIVIPLSQLNQTIKNLLTNYDY